MLTEEEALALGLANIATLLILGLGAQSILSANDDTILFIFSSFIVDSQPLVR